jgi:hypothetical protein
MRTISYAIEQILLADESAFECLKQDTLNLRAYSRSKKAEVEQVVMNKVSLSSMVIALSRLQKKIQSIQPLKPQVKIESIGIKSDLEVITYEKTRDLSERLLRLQSVSRGENDIFMIAESINEISITTSLKEIEKLIGLEYKSKFADVVAITLKFDRKYIEIPNVMYGFVSALALKRVNLIQEISTLTEVAFLVENKDSDAVIDVFKGFLR